MWKSAVLTSAFLLPTIGSAQPSASIRVTEETRLRSFEILADSGNLVSAIHVDPGSIELPQPRDTDHGLCGDLEPRASPIYDTPWEKQQKLRRKLGKIVWRLLELEEVGSLTRKEEKIIEKTPRCDPFHWELNRIREAMAGKGYWHGITNIKFIGGRDSKARIVLNSQKISFKAKKRIRFDSHGSPIGIHSNSYKGRDGKTMKISRTGVKNDGRVGQVREQSCRKWYTRYWVCGPFGDIHIRRPSFEDDCERKSGYLEGEQRVRIKRPKRTEFYRAAIKDTSVMTKFTFNTVRPSSVEELSECEYDR